MKLTTKEPMKFLIMALVSLLPALGWAQQSATIRETTRTYRTYPFSDPDPIPAPAKLYPYFRFDGFTDKPIKKAWKIVELENDYIKVQIMPEIGGKIWTAYDKKTKRDFLYNNGVVKFRDIAMRGPWTSGGIEANYGIIGHTPNTATPVDYLTQKNPDGSVSCFIGALDLLTRTRWTIEIKLEKDKAYFSTRSFWSNTNPVEQPYYSWMNLGIPAGDDLQFIYPGDHYIGHDGVNHPWPIDSSGRNLSFYKENNFGGSKSYHVLGAHSNFFGAYWEHDDYGMVHYARREDKLGKKIFLWAQSDAGKIWEHLLTDQSGQYVEIQSGRLFNQNMFQSSFTPFKQIGFAPYQSDQWVEYWYPYSHIGKLDFANLLGSFHVEKRTKTLRIRFDAVRAIRDTLVVYDKSGAQLSASFIQLNPREQKAFEIPIDEHQPIDHLKLQGLQMNLKEILSRQILSRPLQITKDVDSQTAYGQYLQGRDLLRFRNYAEAEPFINQSLKYDDSYVPALTAKVKLALFHMQYDSAFHYAKRALSMDTYDPEANYYYGLAAGKLGQDRDAKDGFEVAALSPGFRSAAFTALSTLYLQEDDINQAAQYAEKALIGNTNNVEALQLAYLANRLLGQQEKCRAFDKQLTRLDPLNPFLRCERFLQSESEECKQQLSSLIRNEMPVETYLELAIWYQRQHQYEAAKKILKLAPFQPMVAYWLAWLNRTNSIEMRKWLARADGASVKQVFPFREESANILKWAIKESSSWKATYLLTLIEAFRGNNVAAYQTISQVKQDVSFAPFYVVRAQLQSVITQQPTEADLRKAVGLDQTEWRYGQLLAKNLLQNGRYKEAQNVLKPYVDANPENYLVGMSYIYTCMLNYDYLLAEKYLNNLTILPFEGATDGHKYYEETKLMLAWKALEKKDYTLAQQKVTEARAWPRHLGVGEPYENLKDNRMLDWVEAHINKEKGNRQRYDKLLKAITESRADVSAFTTLFQVAALTEIGKGDEAKRLVQRWYQHHKEKEPKDRKAAMDAVLEDPEKLDFPQMIQMVFRRKDKRLF